MTRRILITGATGMLGRQLARDLRAAGSAVFGCSRWPLGASPEELDWLPIACELRQPDEVRRAIRLSAPDVIFHLAAAQASATKAPPPTELWGTNLTGTLNLLLAAAEEAPGARIVVVGSGAEYGPDRIPNSRRRWSESAPARPASPYAASKAAATQTALGVAVAHGLDLTVVRPFNLLGPTRSSDSAPAWFARQVAEMEQNRRDPILRCGNLRAERDFLDVRDASRALCLTAERRLAHPVYNLCSGRATSLQAVAAGLQRLSLCPDIQIPEATEPAPCDRLVGDPRRFQRETGWSPAVPLDQALQALLDHWRRQVRQERSAEGEAEAEEGA